MENAKITFLGTGDAKPTKSRNHTAILLSYKNENILVDCGEGTQRQLKIAGVSAHKITRILITHKHGDHTFGLPGLLSSLALDKFSGVVRIYGPRGIKEYINDIIKLVSVYAGFGLKIEVHEVIGKFIETKEFYVEAESMAHGTPTNAYAFVVKDRVHLDKSKLKKLKVPNSPIVGQLYAGKDIVLNGKKIKASQVRYTEKGKKISFVLDTAMNENAVKFAKNSDLLVSESAFSDEEEARAREYKHMTATQAAGIAKKSNSKKLILTHISQRYEKNFGIIEKEAKKVFKNVLIAKDFLEVEI